LKILKRWFKRNTHNRVQKALASFGRAMNRLYENRNHDIYSNGEVWLLKKLGQFNPEVIIDGGANIGDYALQVARNCPSATIYCFEPVPNTFKILTETTRDISNKANLIQKGLSDNNGVLTINLFESNAHSSFFNHQGITPDLKETIQIEVIKGDDFVSENQVAKIDLLKLDIEGAEMIALKGFEQSLQHGQIKVIQFEYGYLNILTKNLLMDYYDYLEPFGYSLGKLYPKKVVFRAYHNKYEDFIGPNFIAVHHSAQDIIKAIS